jgi:uncharacterized protein with FMN-binding domain
MDQEKPKNSKVLTVGISIVILAIIIFVVFQKENNTEDQTLYEDTPNTNTNTGTTPLPPPPNQTDTKPASNIYKDGTYTAVGSYLSPGGPNTLDLTITIKNDVVTDTSIVSHPGDPKSTQMMQIFADNYKPFVIGKNISTLKLTKVSGSSLTPIGFNNAIAKILVQAKG